MNPRDDLFRLVGELEALMAYSARLNADIVGDRREAIVVRRKVSALFAAFSSCNVSAFSSPALELAYKQELAIFRSTMSRHQGSWTVVAPDISDVEYRASEARARKSSHDFVVWVKQAFSV